MIRIIIADDHIVVCRGLIQIVAAEADMTVVGEAHNAEELVALVRERPCDVVVTDISMPGRTGLEAMEEIKRERPTLPVLVLSMHPDDQYALRALKLGAAGYLTKEGASEELIRAIRTVVAGGRYVRPAIAAQLVSALAAETGRPRHEALSERERQLLSRLATGKSLGQIAAALSVHPATVRAWRDRLVEKLGVRTNAELIHYAIRHGLVGGTAPTGEHLPEPDPE
jgi:two-component system, NarL family, invasion response regulator UvrY